MNAYLDCLGQLINQFGYLNDEGINQALTQKQTARLETLNDKMGKVAYLKSSLYPSLVKGIISAEDYSEMNAAYSDEIIELEKSVKALSSEVQGIIAHKNQQLEWLKAICKLVEIKGFDRTSIVQLIKWILVKSKIDVEVQFNFELFEHQQIRLPPCLLEKLRRNKIFEEKLV